MVNYNDKGNEKIQLKNNEERNNIDVGIGSQDRAHHSEMEDPVCLHRRSIDLGMYYIDRAIDAMEEWHSKPRAGYHVTDVCLCPRQKVFREIDPRPICAKTVSIRTTNGHD